MTRYIKIGLLLVCQLLIISSWVYADEHQHRASCRVCGMYIDQYQKSAAELVYKDGKKEYTCGVACMLREIEDEGGIAAFKSVKVHDWVSGKLVDAETATYVMGSKVIPDMVPNSSPLLTETKPKLLQPKKVAMFWSFKSLTKMFPR